MMQCLFIITNELSLEQIERQYLLMIAMLNFDFQVNVVFIGNTHANWQNDDKLNKHLKALSMYGAQCHQLHNKPGKCTHYESPSPLSSNGFTALKNSADLIS